MGSNILQKLAKKYVKGSASQREKELLESYYEHMQHSGNYSEGIDEALQTKIFARISTKIDEHPVAANRLSYWYSVAAALFLIVGVGLFLSSLRNNTPDKAKTILVLTKKGERKRIRLPDSSTVWINADSRLSYPEKFDTDKRIVKLVGEAYFEVKHNDRQPFTVSSAKMNIKVLGTVFNIRAYPNEQSEASLVQGSIQVSLPASNKPIAILKPNQKFIVGDDLYLSTSRQKIIDAGKDFIITRSVPKKSTQTLSEIEWKNNRLSFDDENFGEVAILIERWYNVKINITRPELLNYRFTGTFNNIELKDVLESLKTSQDFSYRKEGSTIYIY